MANSMTVSQNFNLVNAKYKLTPMEMKFILNAISHLDSKQDKNLEEYEIKISELEQKMQIGKGQHTRFKQFAKKLMSKPLVINGENGDYEIYNWFSRIRYVNNEAKFFVRFEEGLKPYLLELKKRFVSYNLKYILPLTSTYSMRIYQLLIEYENLTKRYFMVDELQDILQVPESYRNYTNFNAKVLKVAQRELLEHTDICFTVKEEKKGRKVNRLIFRIRKNTKNMKEELKELKETLNKYENLTQEYNNNNILYYNGQDQTIQEVIMDKDTKECNVLLIDSFNSPHRYTMPFEQLKLAKNSDNYI